MFVKTHVYHFKIQIVPYRLIAYSIDNIFSLSHGLAVVTQIFSKHIWFSHVLQTCQPWSLPLKNNKSISFHKTYGVLQLTKNIFQVEQVFETKSNTQIYWKCFTSMQTDTKFHQSSIFFPINVCSLSR